MRRPEFIARQSSCPSGWLGRVIARIMAKETTVENALALRLLDPTPRDVILEIGFGHGRVIAELASRCPQGRVRGLDSSTTMVQMATRLNQATIDRGLVQLDVGDSSALPYASEMFDRVLTVHTVYFWSQPLDDFREILRVLKPGGKLVVGFRPDSERFRSAFPASVYRFRSQEQIHELLVAAGFHRIQELPPGASAREVSFTMGFRS
jgi:SAM-dependent methyltransferase